MGLGVLLPQLSVYRQHARLLCFETARAAHGGRSADAATRIEQSLTLARHAGEDGTLIAQLVSVAIAHMTFDTINRTVRDYPALFTDEQLQRLAHRVSAFSPVPEGSAAWRPNLTLERLAFEDVLQRFFTDDGNGDGRLCNGMMYYHSEFGAVEPKAAKFLNPVIAGVVAGRRETSSLYNRFMDRVESENAKPRYLRDVASLERELDELKSGMGIRNSLVALMVPAIAKAASSFDIGCTLRDATAAGLSVELYGRKNGRFPASWSDLVPHMLPAAPRDPWSGLALGFKAGAGTSGRPVIYSIGADRTDNGGTIGTPWDVISAWSSATVPTLGGQTSTGDWVIWPKPEPVGERPQFDPALPIGATPSSRVYQWGWLGGLMGN